MTHPRDVLFEAGDAPPTLPVCDHYAGVEARMRKSLQLQRALGPVFDVTLDGEDGAPAGGEIDQARLIAALVMSSDNVHGRVGVRIVSLSHPAFEPMLEVLVREAGPRLAYIMLPKAGSAAQFDEAAWAVDRACDDAGLARRIPLHALVETHGALAEVGRLAAHPRLESLSFGLMDFVSAHRGAIPHSAMTADGQFTHPLVVRAKLEIAAACHAHGKTPAHGVVTEFKEPKLLQRAAERACRQFGYTRMWSIHPDQVPIILDAFAPTAAEVDLAIEVLVDAEAAAWGPIRHRHLGREQLHDRASYRYFWEVLERAHRTSVEGDPQLPAEIRFRWFSHAG